MNLSLKMKVEYIDGKYVIDAPWLDELVSADTWFEAHYQANRAYLLHSMCELHSSRPNLYTSAGL